MAYFSEADINEAKRRVMDMRNRANRYTNSLPYENSEKNEPPPVQNKKRTENRQENQSPFKGIFNEIDNILNSEEDKSFLIILALILILSREGADNKLILALIYLLL